MHASEEEKQLQQAIRDSLEDGRLPCAKAFQIARDLKVPLHKIGDVCDRLRIKVSRCRLGCFP